MCLIFSVKSIKIYLQKKYHLRTTKKNSNNEKTCDFFFSLNCVRITKDPFYLKHTSPIFSGCLTCLNHRQFIKCFLFAILFYLKFPLIEVENF